MDYKEKYEMALEGIQEILGSGEDSIKMSRLQMHLQGIFPELKESEDEKIRKVLLELVRQSSEVLDKQNQNNMIAWLEKQGTVIKDAISMDVNSETEWDDIHKFLRNNLDGEKVKLLIVKEE